MLIVSKPVDDILLAGTKEQVSDFFERISAIYKIWSIAWLPGSFKFFGLTNEQDGNGRIRLHADDKLQALEENVITRPRRKQFEDGLSTVELTAFQSLNGSLGFLGMTVSPFAVFPCSHLQQLENGYKVRDLVKQLNMLRAVKRMGSVSTFERPPINRSYEVSVPFFADAARPSSPRQLGLIGGLLIGGVCIS